jgi:hypothetical protein
LERVLIKYKMSEEKDPLLQAPQEANTTKHINFAELEETDNSSTSNSQGSEDESPTKKAWQQMREDEKRDKAKDE